LNDLNQWGTFNLSPRIALLQASFQAAIGLIETDYMTEIMATVDMLKKAMVKEVKPWSKKLNPTLWLRVRFKPREK